MSQPLDMEREINLALDYQKGLEDGSITIPKPVRGDLKTVHFWEISFTPPYIKDDKSWMD